MMHNLRVGLGVMIVGAIVSCAKQESGDDTTGNAGAGGNGNSVGGTGNSGIGSTSNGGTAAGNASAGGNGNVGGGVSNVGGGSSTSSGNVGGNGATGTGVGGSTTEACTTVSGETKSGSAPPVIEFVLDNTNSMSDATQPSTKGLSKWKALQNAFASAIPTLAAEHPEYAVGLTYFHYRGYGTAGNPCTDALQAVEIAPLTTTQSSSLVNNVNSEGQIQMTPTQDIWQFGADHALAWGANDPVYAESNRYVVVLTDGVPTVGAGCTDAGGCSSSGGTSVTVAQYQTFITAVGNLKTSQNLTTFMIAIPGAEAMNQVTCSNGTVLYTPIDKMKEVATAGGTSLIDLTTSATTDFTVALVDAITKQIAGSVTTVVGCDYKVPDPPTDPLGNIQFINPNDVRVMYFENGGTTCSSASDCSTRLCSPSTADNPNRCYREIVRSQGCADVNGWDYADSTNTTIKLCSSACSTAQADPGAKIEISIGCFQVG